ncbi:MAG TPA: GTP-dependent dephospho-CoA kinase family protein, partial [Candidatus Methanoperedens sp.]
CLPDELKAELRKLHGELYCGNGLETAKQILKDLKNPAKVISVGDIVTFNLLNAGLIPDLSFVDDRTKRGPASDSVMNGTKHPRFETVTVENPPGMITEALMNEVSKAMKSDTPVRIFIKGEEDLAALPAIALAPLSSAVIYGLPDEGAVLVRVTESKKKEIRSFLDKMKCKEKK